MKKLILITSFALLSCGEDEGAKIECSGGHHKDVAGLEICSEGKISTAEIEYMVQVVEQQTAIRYPEVKDLPKALKDHSVKVYFVDDDMAVKCEEIEYDVYRCDSNVSGVNVDGHNIYVRYYPCLAYTSLGHELLHSIESYYLDTPDDVDHTTPWLFEIGNMDNYKDTVEYKIFEISYPNLESCQ